MNTVRVWHMESFILALCGVISLKVLPGFGILTCLVLCNVALVLGIRNRQYRFAVAGITLPVVGLVLSLLFIVLAMYSIAFVNGMSHAPVYYF
ncbi:hypothetical protein GCM10025859_45880 [Alicyclobacillus fastidiosus]|nr:hypothetical protein GCM10025859_45880 [Alicyclobacillus fastidiosus]